MQKVRTLALLCSFLAGAQGAPPAETTAKMIVTIGHFDGPAPAPLTPNDLTVTQGLERIPVSGLNPFRGDRAGLELVLLVDCCSTCEPGSKFNELRNFVASQPSTTKIGVAYIRDGRLDLVQKPTHDLKRAVKALSVPAGSTPANPFGALTDLIQGWQNDSSRHAVLMISNGIDPSTTDGLHNSSAEAAIKAAQRVGVVVYSIYHPSVDYEKADVSQIWSGQTQLAHVAVETGGESYFIGLGPLPLLGPFLSDIAEHLANQYLLEFITTPAEVYGEFREVTIKSNIREIRLMAPRKVWVSGRDSTDPKSNALPE